MQILEHNSNLDKSQVWILIPAYNEADQIGSVLDRLINCGWENILVVDDGSSDNTEAIAKEKGADTLKLIINRGQGAALQTGIEYLRHKKNPLVIVSFDADGQHNPEDIPALIAPILSKKANIVLGSRFLNHKSKVPPLRKAILKTGVLFTCLISDIRLTDTHNGLKAMDSKAYTSVKIKQRGMEHASEIIDEIKRRKLSYCEVPVTVIYTDYSLKKGQKNTNFIKLGIRLIFKKLAS